MREGWESKTLGEIIEKSGTIDPRKTPDMLFQYVDVSGVSNQSFEIVEAASLLGKDAPSRARRLIKSSDVIFATIRPTLQRIAQVPEELDGQVCSTGYFVFRTKPEVEPRYLYYYLFSTDFMGAMEKLQSGASYPAVNDTQVKSQTIPLPPLAEQKQIVGVLDEVFAAIGVAAANAKKNLANANELFETTLNNIFTQKGERWETKTLGEVSSINYGYTAKASFEVVGPRFLRITDIQNETVDWAKVPSCPISEDDRQKHKLRQNDIVFARTGATTGKSYLVQNPPDAIAASYLIRLRLENKNVFPPFVSLFFQSAEYWEAVEAGTTGSAQGGFNASKLGVMAIPLPFLAEQKRIVVVLDDLFAQTQHLKTIYQLKLDDLDELKQSILQKAFAGELSGVATTTPEFTANVICLAHFLHAKEQRERTFGRVKAQKDLHLTESIGGIELGRQPIKDAAGPNDSAHMRRAENWAKGQHFFEFVQREGGRGYDFIKLTRYDEMKAKALAMLKPYRDRLKNVTDLLIWKDTEQAEVFTTIHAAWNNLIIDGAEITDEAIIFEARENWHAKKMKIDKSKFKTALHEIRQKNLIPDGTAKYVGKRQESFL